MTFTLQDQKHPQGPSLWETLLQEYSQASVAAGAYAFATRAGIKALMDSEQFSQFIEEGTCHLVIGADDITDLTALAELKERVARYEGHLTIQMFVHGGTRVFHPKFCWFQRQGSGEADAGSEDAEDAVDAVSVGASAGIGTAPAGSIVVGSGNLTAGGLARNWEAFVHQDLTQEELDQVKAQWTTWLEDNQEYLHPLEDMGSLRKVRANSKFWDRVKAFLKGVD